MHTLVPQSRCWAPPIHAAVVAAAEGPVDDVELLPRGARRSRRSPVTASALRMTLRTWRHRRPSSGKCGPGGFDIACQMHGGGRFSNPFVLRLGARHTVGTRTKDAEPLERNLDYVYYQNEPDRWLEVAGLAGAPTIISPPLLLPPKPEHQQNIVGLRDPQRASLVVVHPGATDPRRRWPASNFAQAAAGGSSGRSPGIDRG